jgi:hypothetical protein
VAGELHAQALGHRVDRVLERVVGERLHLACSLVDEVVVVALGIGDLEPRDPVTAIEAVEQAEFEQLVHHAVDGGRRARPLRTQPIGDLLRGEQALTVPRQQLDHRGASSTRSEARSGGQLYCPREPPIAKLRVHPPECRSRSLRFDDRHRPVVVAMVAVGMMQVPADQVIDVAVVRNRLVPAALTVSVLGIVCFAVVVGRAPIGMLGIHSEDVLVDMVAVRVVEVAVVHVVDVVFVPNGSVTAPGRVLVIVMFVDLVIAHEAESRSGTRRYQATESETRSQLSAQGFAPGGAGAVENRELRRFSPRDPGAPLDGIGQFLHVPGMRELIRREQLMADLSADESAIASGLGSRAALARAMLRLSDSFRIGDGAGIEPERVHHLAGARPDWRFSALLIATGIAVTLLIGALALLAGQVAVGSATLEPPFLSTRPCVLVLAAIPVVLTLGGLWLTRGYALAQWPAPARRSHRHRCMSSRPRSWTRSGARTARPPSS